MYIHLLSLGPPSQPSPQPSRSSQNTEPGSPCQSAASLQLSVCLTRGGVHVSALSRFILPCPALPCPTHRVCKSILEVSVSLFLNSNAFCIYVFNCVYTEYMQILSTQQTPSFFNKWKTMYGSVITSRRELRR